jgi:hypothetical protein
MGGVKKKLYICGEDQSNYEKRMSYEKDFVLWKKKT